MRLTCPNCDAQYEVPDEVIPTSGRDVQCSNCGQTWFQHHRDHMPPDEDDEPDLDAPTPDEEVSPPPPPPPPSPPPPQPQRKELDPQVADILREEAEAEYAARRAPQQNDALETQADLGLEEADAEDDTERRSRQAAERMARMRGEPPPVSEAAATAAAVGSRRDLLPDIEEINSTLRSTSDRAAGMSDTEVPIASPTEQRKKRSFRTGFMIIILIAILLIMLYILAPQIAKAVPAVDPWLNNYIAQVDQFRLWLDGQIQTFLAWLEQAASNSGDGS